MTSPYSIFSLPKASLLLPLLAVLTTILPATAKPNNELSLAGKWAFALDEEDVGLDENWFEKELSDSVQLPGSLPEQEKGKPTGYDTKFTGSFWKSYPAGQTWVDDPLYKPFFKEDEFRFPFWLISDYHYVGPAWYQKEVELSQDWAEGPVELFLERPHWETQVWVNGKKIGMQTALGVPHRFPIGEALTAGKHTITLRIDNRQKDIQVGENAHSISDNTQSNWNGVVGELKLIRKPAVSVANVAIFPNIPEKKLRLEISLANASDQAQTGRLKVSARVKTDESLPPLADLSLDAEAAANGNTLTLDYPLGEELHLWDEFDPNLYELTVNLDSSLGTHSWVGDFGLRDLASSKEGLSINGRPLYLRGTLECAIFPKTGYPPTTVEPWERIIRIAKEHGLNHIRFHSWCPPKAAFIAADKMGFYYQVESSAWAGDIGSGKAIDQWVYDESERMVAEYGNHPSFALMPYGNEPHGPNHKAYLQEFVKHWKGKDGRHLYTTGAGWPAVPENDFHNLYHYLRIQGWNANLNSIINAEPPRSDYDWSPAASKLDAPVVSHEIGQWCVYPNFKEIPKYDGVLKATNFKLFRDSLDAAGLLHLADDYVQASGKLQALCYKADIEAALRTKGFGGFQLLDIRDFTGQGTALVGILDPFWDEKGYISPAEFRQFCDETVPLARLPKHIFTSDETVSCPIEVAHYGPQELDGVVPKWTVLDTEGQTVRTGELTKTRLAWGNAQKLGTFEESFPVTEATQYELQVEVAGFTNSWDFWVYPAELPEVESGFLLTRTLDENAEAKLAQGGTVFLSIEKGTIRDGKGGEVGVGFSSIFWNTAWTNNQLPHTLGILCDPDHPALADFPTEFHSNWQWWDAMSHSNAISLGDFAEKPTPLVRLIDDWNTNRNLALLFEVKVGKGRLLFSGVDLISDLENRPAARQLRHSLENYLTSDSFQPKTATDLATLRNLFKSPSELFKSSAQATARNFQKGHEPENLLDGDPKTMWHTNWKTNLQAHPHEVVIDLGKPTTLKGITCLPRQDGNANGLIADYEVYLSDDPNRKGTLMTQGTFPAAAQEQTLLFKSPQEGRYLTFVARSSHAGANMSSLAEIGFLID